MDVFLGRLPVFGRGLEVFGYEVLHGNAPGAEVADRSDGERVNSQVLSSPVAEAELQQLVGERFAFVNFSEGLLTGRRADPRIQGRLVVGVLEDVPDTDDVVRGMAELREQGHLIALDDFVPGGKQMRLLPHADLVKLDFRALDERRFAQVAESLIHRGLKLVAENLESREEFEFCRDLGVDFFQGEFLTQPGAPSDPSIPTRSLAAVKLMAEYRRPGVELEDIHRLTSRDESLAFQLLAHTNSSLYGLRQAVASAREAVNYLGLDRVQNLASLFALSSLGPPALVEIATQRARMAEHMAQVSGSKIADQHFAVGLFSCLEALVGAPLELLLERLPLARGVSDALLDGSGELGATLACVLAYERGEWARVRHPRLRPAQLRQCYLESITWTATCAAAEARAA